VIQKKESLMSKSVLAIASSQAAAQVMINSLRGGGFVERDISIVTTVPGGTRDIRHQVSSKAPEGASAGALSGGAVGGTIGVLAGIGMLAIPGLGPFIAAGPLLVLLSGAAIGATVGGVAGGLIGLGIPEIEAKAYESRLHRGEVLIAVHALDNDQASRAKDIFKSTGATDIRVIGEVAPPREDLVR